MLAAPPGWAPPARRKDGRLHKERQAACAEMAKESGSGRRQQIRMRLWLRLSVSPRPWLPCSGASSGSHMRMQSWSAR